MRKSNNDDDGGWDELDRWASETDGADSANSSKPLSASEQVTLIDESVAKVRTLWRNSVNMICNAAAEVARTVKRLDAEHKKRYAKKLGYGNTVFNMLKRIGEDKRIPKIIKHLSPSISTIYQVSHLSNEQLKLGISEGIVNPGATRDDIKIFRGSHKSPPKPATPSEPKQHLVKASDVHDDPDEYLEDEEFLEDEPQDEPETSEESNTFYQALVTQWKAGGVRRSTWRTTPENERQKFIKEVFVREPFTPSV